MPRSARVINNEGIYHVMERGNEKREIFRDDEDRTKFLQIVSCNKERYGFNVYAYCLMSNHVHLLLGCNGCNISQMMKSINISYVHFFNRKYRRCGHLFQDRFKSELVDTDAYVIEVSRYIHLNPVRAMMVSIDDITQYPWSSYTQYISNKNGHLLPVDTNFILGIFSDNLQMARRQYQSYLMRSEDNLPEKTGMSAMLQAKPLFVNSDTHYNSDRQKILEILAADYGVDWADVKAGKISNNIRNEMIITARRTSHLTLKAIGEIFGGLSESMVSKIIKTNNPSSQNSSQEPSLGKLGNRMMG